MGLRIIVGFKGGDTDSSVENAVFYCSVVDVAFGPVIYARSGEALMKAQAFLDFARVDLRSISEEELSKLYSEFIGAWGPGDAEKAAHCECGHDVEDHDWWEIHGSSRRICTAQVPCPSEDDAMNTERCDCVGGWHPAQKKAVSE